MDSEASDLENSLDSQVAITGVAENAKAGAVVMTNRDQVIYLQGMREWPDELLGKHVVINGTLRRGRVYPDVEMKNGLVSQGIHGEQWFIEEARYRVAD